MKRSRDNEDDQPSNSSTMRKMSKLAMEPVGQFDTCPIPNYRQPIEVGCYSLDIHKAVHLDRRALRTYSRPDKRINLDLSVGYDEYIEKEGSDYLDHILTWITSNKSWLQRYTATSLPLIFKAWFWNFYITEAIFIIINIFINIIGLSVVHVQ